MSLIDSFFQIKQGNSIHSVCCTQSDTGNPMKPGQWFLYQFAFKNDTAKVLSFCRVKYLPLFCLQKLLLHINWPKQVLGNSRA